MYKRLESRVGQLTTRGGEGGRGIPLRAMGTRFIKFSLSVTKKMREESFQGKDRQKDKKEKATVNEKVTWWWVSSNI